MRIVGLVILGIFLFFSVLRSLFTVIAIAGGALDRAPDMNFAAGQAMGTFFITAVLAVVFFKVLKNQK